MRRRSLRAPVAIAVVAAAWGCHSDSSGDPASRLGRAATGAPVPLAASTSSVAPGPPSCPASMPVVCKNGCCPTGSACLGGSCVVDQQPAACPLSLPVVCATTVSCGAGCVGWDDSGLGNHARFVAQPAGFAPGKYGTGATTGQASQVCSANHIVASPITGFPSSGAPLSMEAWFKTTYPQQQPLITLYNSAYNGGLTSLILTNNCLAVGNGNSGLGPDGGLATCWQCVPATAADGSWHHAAAVSDGSHITLYLDGKNLKTCAGSLSQTTTAVWIGDVSALDCNTFIGTLDEIRISAAALLDADIAADATSLVPLQKRPDTVALWHFDEASESIRCCPAGSGCDPGGGCTAPCNAMPSCPGGTVACNGSSPPGTCCPNTVSQCFYGEGCSAGVANAQGNCPSGFTNQGGQCFAPFTFVCGNGPACGSVCTPVGGACEDAGACVAGPQPSGCGTICGSGPACCPPGTQCQGDGGCEGVPNTLAEPDGGSLLGPACDPGYCPVGEGCSNGRCCPADHPLGCGTECCLPGSACNAGACGCPGGTAPCGTLCCGVGETCSSGACQVSACPSTAPAPCGTQWCCSSADACGADQQCHCTTDYPVDCADSCCLPGAACSSGVCQCPAGRAACGDNCCAAGMSCVAGACKSTNGGGGDCSGGQLGSVRFCIQNGISGPCDCNIDSTSTCVTPDFWQQNFGGPYPAACAGPNANCVGQDGRTIIAYCCPGLSCLGIGGPACGVDAGTCQPH